MSSYPSLNGSQIRIGQHIFQFMNNKLVVAQKDDPAAAVLRLDGSHTLDLINWLVLYRGSLFEIVTREDVEAFKAQVRADYGLPEPEEQCIYVPPSSCDEILVALASAGGVALCCDECHVLLCVECYNCHNRKCRYFIAREHSDIQGRTCR